MTALEKGLSRAAVNSADPPETSGSAWASDFPGVAILAALSRLGAIGAAVSWAPAAWPGATAGTSGPSPTESLLVPDRREPDDIMRNARISGLTATSTGLMHTQVGRLSEVLGKLRLNAGVTQFFCENDGERGRSSTLSVSPKAAGQQRRMPRAKSLMRTMSSSRTSR